MSDRPLPAPIRMMRRRPVAAFAAATCLVAFAAGPVRACDTALLLAMDVSGSIDAGEYRLQRGRRGPAVRSRQRRETRLAALARRCLTLAKVDLTRSTLLGQPSTV